MIVLGNAVEMPTTADYSGEVQLMPATTSTLTSYSQPARSQSVAAAASAVAEPGYDTKHNPRGSINYFDC